MGLTTGRASQLLVQGLAVDSREVRPGYLFAALPGEHVHGAEFTQFALRQGASVILTDPYGADLIARTLPVHVAEFCVVDDPRQALAGAAALFFWLAASGDSGGDGHQWQNFCRDLLSANLDSYGPESGELRHDRC